MTTPSLMPSPRQKFTDNSGKPLVNGMLFTYAAGTSTPLAAYKDPAGTVAHPNPIRLDARGEATVYFVGNYKIDLKSASGVQITGYPVDNFSVPDIDGGATDLEERLAATGGGSLVGFKQTGGGTVALGVNKKLLAMEISPDDFGATGTSIFPGDTAAVQAAFNDGRPVKFTRDYYVDNVYIAGVGRTVDFNDYALVGCTTYSPDYLLAIKGRELKLTGVKVDANFKSYTSAVRWFSASSSEPAQYNKVFGLHICNASAGLTYGQSIGTASTDAAQSENTIFGYTTRAVRNPWIGNQSNGFMTLVSPILDCAPYEWTTQPGYDSTAYQTAATCITNALGSLVTVGGEFLKTTTQLGYGLRGNSVTMLAPTLEIAGSQAYVDGNFTISDNLNGYQSSDSAPAFKIAPATVGTLNLQNVVFSRGAGVGAYSGARFIDDTGTTAAFRAIVGGGGQIVEWPWPFGNFRTIYRDVLVTETAASGQRMLGGSTDNLLIAKGVDTFGYTTSGWYFKQFYGPGSTMTVAAAGPSGYLPVSLQLHATGESQATTTDETSASTIIATSFRVRPTEIFRLNTFANISAGTNARVVANFYTAAGAIISLVPIIDAVTMSQGSFSQVGGVLRVPANAAYMGIGVYATASDIQITDVRFSRG